MIDFTFLFSTIPKKTVTKLTNSSLISDKICQTTIRLAILLSKGAPFLKHPIASIQHERAITEKFC